MFSDTKCIIYHNHAVGAKIFGGLFVIDILYESFYPPLVRNMLEQGGGKKIRAFFTQGPPQAENFGDL